MIDIVENKVLGPAILKAEAITLSRLSERDGLESFQSGSRRAVEPRKRMRY
jgi:hypothetical protein